MQSVNAITPDNGMTAAKVRTAEPSKKITESFGSFMAGTQGDDSFKSTASVMDNIGRTSGVRQNRKAVRSDDAFTTSDTTSQNVQNAGGNRGLGPGGDVLWDRSGWTFLPKCR